jgi:hypothetical protein
MNLDIREGVLLDIRPETLHVVDIHLEGVDTPLGSDSGNTGEPSQIGSYVEDAISILRKAGEEIGSTGLMNPTFVAREKPRGGVRVL